MMSALMPAWSAALSVAWVVAAQGICGIAKDLTKTASKSAIKLTAGDAAGRLFRWVAWFTGSKNAMKGCGFFLGGLLLELLGFRGALWAMAGVLGVILMGVMFSLPPRMGKAQASASAREFFAKGRGINLLAAARCSCSARGTFGLWSVCRSSSMRLAGPSPWSAAFWGLDHRLRSCAGRSAILGAPWRP